MKINGWNILFHPVFDEQWQNFRSSVKSLRSRLSQEDFVKHPQVKLFKAVTIGIEQKIPSEPLASYFALKKPLQKYSRMKKMGLPNRYRLFFKVFSEQQTIIILWLGFPRKQGDKKDCYQVFSKMVEQGQFPTNLLDLLS
jgi:toxin YhaV